ncbi:hypothetical protein [Methyloraptor flagellatus]|jgi:hypothetical protein|uniref:Uncharacterized protein n=1 Tax=Methyloraptor flagellatus TaxID=3162530 RepID=A0AAU7X479_9HYPH
MGVVVPFSAERRDPSTKRPRQDECGRVLLFDGVRIERTPDTLDLAARRPALEPAGPGAYPTRN